MNNKDIKVPFHDPLSDWDTEQQTFGCRQNNPDICKYNGMDDICAFCRDDKLCKHPSRAWAKQYGKLLRMNNE